MPEHDTVMTTLGVDDTTLEEITERLTDEAPSVAALMQAMRQFTVATIERLDDLPEETIDLRRSHLTLLVGLVDDVRAILAETFANIDLDGRVVDADVAEPITAGLQTAGEGLGELITVLHHPRQN